MVCFHRHSLTRNKKEHRCITLLFLSVIQLFLADLALNVDQTYVLVSEYKNKVSRKPIFFFQIILRKYENRFLFKHTAMCYQRTK